MGADLICYIAVGPKEIQADDTKIEELTDRLMEYRTEVIAACQRYLTNQSEDAQLVLPAFSSAAKAFCTIYVNDFDDVTRYASLASLLAAEPDWPAPAVSLLQLVDMPGLASLVDNDNTDYWEDRIVEFIKFWNTGDYRDAARREYNDKAIVIAGDMSWGDSPDGAGFKALELAFQIGLCHILGIE